MTDPDRTRDDLLTGDPLVLYGLYQEALDLLRAVVGLTEDCHGCIGLSGNDELLARITAAGAAPDDNE